MFNIRLPKGYSFTQPVFFKTFPSLLPVNVFSRFDLAHRKDILSDSNNLFEYRDGRNERF